MADMQEFERLREELGSLTPNLSTFRKLTFTDDMVPLTPKNTRTGRFGFKIRVSPEADFESLGIRQPEIVQEDSGFVIGGQNSSETIKGLTSINGISIEALERAMRPGLLSDDGFLGPDESLLEVLTRDNDYVLNAGLTHQAIAAELKYMVDAPGIQSEDGLLFQRGNSIFSRMMMGSFGSQESPFNDGTSGCSDFIIVNRTTLKVCAFSDLHTDMIGRYGFYEGLGTDYRVSPEEIINTFDHLKG